MGGGQTSHSNRRSEFFRIVFVFHNLYLTYQRNTHKRMAARIANVTGRVARTLPMAMMPHAGGVRRGASAVDMPKAAKATEVSSARVLDEVAAVRTLVETMKEDAPSGRNGNLLVFFIAYGMAMNLFMSMDGRMMVIDHNVRVLTVANDLPTVKHVHLSAIARISRVLEGIKDKITGFFTGAKPKAD